MFRFQFYRDYYNRNGEFKQVDLYSHDKDFYSLKETDGFDYLLVMDLNKPVGAIGYKVVREEGTK